MKYAVTTMGSVVPFPPDDDTESGMLNPQFTMQSLGDLPMAASEGGESNTDVGRGVGIAVANDMPMTVPFIDTLVAAGKTLVTPTPVAVKPAGGGGGGSSTLPTTTGSGGIFGDLFGANTDAIVIGTGLLVASGVAFMMYRKHTSSPAPRRRR